MTRMRRALVVEDETLIRMFAIDLLLELGYESDEAGSAREALDKLQARDANYAIVFLDIGLPDRPGDDLIKDIRSSHSDLPLLVASGEDPAVLESSLAGFGPIAFLGKPYDSKRLRAALVRLMGKEAV